MINWAFKKIVKMREKVAVDLGQPDEEKPFLDHLEDLRTMIMRMVITLLVVVIGAFFFYQDLMAIIERPLVVAGVRDKISLQNLKVIGGFMTAMNISIVAGIVAAFPFLLYFLLQFILPGMRNNEKKVIFPAIGVGGGLFLIGVLFAYFFVTPRALKFFYEFSLEMDQSSAANTPGSTPPDKLIWERVEYVKFVCQFILIFGACFELPVVVMALVKLDILNYKVMKGTRGWAAIIICVAAAIITPTQDAMTLGLLAIPMYVLYEICIWLAWALEKRDRKLYPEYYKDRDEDEKALDVSDDWDNDEYNPWSDTNPEDDDETDTQKPKTTPANTTTPNTQDPTQSPNQNPTQDPTQNPTQPEPPPSDDAANDHYQQNDLNTEPNPTSTPSNTPPTQESAKPETPPSDDDNNDPYNQDNVEKRNLD